jgi:hypothetical protein
MPQDGRLASVIRTVREPRPQRTPSRSLTGERCPVGGLVVGLHRRGAPLVTLVATSGRPTHPVGHAHPGGQEAVDSSITGLPLWSALTLSRTVSPKRSATGGTGAWPKPSRLPSAMNWGQSRLFQSVTAPRQEGDAVELSVTRRPRQRRGCRTSAVREGTSQVRRPDEAGGRRETGPCGGEPGLPSPQRILAEPQATTPSYCVPRRTASAGA